MSVLIKGMKMPKNCLECEWHEYYGGDYNWCHACRKTGTMPIENAEIQRADDCPLVKLPEKHGRLIDVDTLIKALIRKEPFNDCAKVVIAECMEEVRHASTVIEAEGKT